MFRYGSGPFSLIFAIFGEIFFLVPGLVYNRVLKTFRDQNSIEALVRQTGQTKFFVGSYIDMGRSYCASDDVLFSST